VLYPSKKKITSCQDCGKCLFETPGVCKYNDDMTSIILKMEEAELLVFASPVYFDSMSSNMKKTIGSYGSAKPDFTNDDQIKNLVDFSNMVFYGTPLTAELKTKFYFRSLDSNLCVIIQILIIS
jgi:multimeric flavodoxin WrbA